MSALAYVLLYRCKTREFSIVVAAEDMSQARRIADEWASSTHQAGELDWRITRTRSVGDSVLVTEGAA